MNKKLLYAIIGLAILATVVAAAPPALRERIAIYAKDDSWIVNGFDIIWYSNDRVTETARIDGATGNFTTSGSLTPASGLDLNGKDLIIDADADTILGQTGSTDDVADLTLGAGSGYFSILVGNMRVGNGSPTISQDGEDLYVESQLEVDGEAQFDGAVDANSTSDFADTATFSKGSGNALVVSSGGAIDANGASDFADTATFSKGSGNAVVISSGGALDANGAGDFADTLTLSKGSGNALVVSAGGAADLNGDLDVANNSTLGDAADDSTTVNGQVVVNGIPDTDAANYDYFMQITGDMTGTGTKDRNYGLLIEMTRPAGQEVASGDHDEAGLKIRVDTEAVTTTAGTVLRGADIEAKADNPGGTVTNLHGALITAKSDTSAGDVADMWGLSVNAQNNAAVTANLLGADVRVMRQAATEPSTLEALLRLRNSSTSGTGADAGIYMTSDYGSSATTDSMDYGIDMSTAAINTADIRMENGETLDNGTDTVISFSAFVGAAEQSALVLTEGGTITPTGTYQPITSAAAITTSATTAIADGVKNGQLLILVNENAADAIIVKDSANTHLSGDLTLGNDDTIMLIWDGADWVELGTSNNS